MCSTLLLGPLPYGKVCLQSAWYRLQKHLIFAVCKVEVLYQQKK